MAIYHLEAKVVSQGAGRSAVAASAYLSCSRLYNDYDGIQHDYTKKQGLLWQQVFLPEYALQEWQDREKLWNAVEEVETAKDSRLAREFVVALPIELSREQQIELLQDFIREQLVAWRAAWADVSNRYLERAGREERIDHRSNAARGIDEIPTIHEGVAAQALERKGIISDRCEINRQIKADNAMLRELKAEIKKLAALVARTVPAIAEGLEKLRSRVLIYCYQLSHICSGKSHIQKSLAVWKPELERYTGLVQQIKAKSKERKTLVAEKKELPIYHVKRHKALAVRIAELTEDLEELRFEKALLLQKFEYAEDAGAEAFRKDIATMEACLKKLETREQKYSVELDKALTEYAELKAQAADFDPVELYKARQVIRPAQEKAAEQQLEDAMHEKPSLIMLLSAKQETSHLLGADAEERQARQLIMHRNQEQYRNSLSKRKRNDPER